MKIIDQKRWLPYPIIALTLIILAALFLWPAAWEFPMDDTYIHFVYAQNMAEDGRLFFNHPDEVGVGSTSLTWVLLLAGAYRVGIPLHLAAKLLGILALIGSGWALYSLARSLLSSVPALAFSLLVTASGHMVWFALSGMETMLFLSIGLLCLVLYRDKRWIFLGLALGVLVNTRPDGLALPAAIGLIELWKYRRNLRQMPRGVLAAGLICLVISSPWFGYLLWRTGNILPTSAVGKQTSSLIGIRLILSHSPYLSLLAQFPALIYAGTWFVYIFAFVLGGAALPGPRLPIGTEVGNANYSVALLAIAGWLLIIAPLLFRFSGSVFHFIRSKSSQLDQYRPIIVFAAWLILHNLAYAFFLPIPGTASRYGTINHVALWLALFIGIYRFAPRPNWRAVWAVGVVLIAFANTFYWNQVYDANLEHMQNVRIAASQYIVERVPDDEQIAAFDVGAVRFYTDRPIIDLGGLIDPALDEVYREDGSVDRYLAERDVRYVILPGRTNTINEGWFDFAREMGLTTSPWFTLQKVQVFEIDYQRWLLGYLPTNNYQATVTIYHLLD
jgi:hypothetical protein